MSKNPKRGRLKIYLGMAAGVGKTYAMLKDAQRELHETKTDIIAGYIEPHGRVETEVLVESFEVIPTRDMVHGTLSLKEFDLEAALRRAPHTILLDELAHTNAPGSIHNKRWLDVLALLDAGINVYSTLNIQHLESTAEVVSSLCGISVQETIPDSVLREADAIEVIDIPPEELIDRLKAGKIYKKEKVDAALRNFFKEGHLLALREILLRKAAEKIDRDVIKFRESVAVRDSWATSDRMIVAIGPNQFAKRLIQKAVRIAASRKSALSVISVQTPHLGVLGVKEQNQLDDALRLAHDLGATIEKRFGTDIVSEILKTSISLNASLILVGKPLKNKIREILFGSLADELVRRSGNIDILLVTGEEDDSTIRPLIIRDRRPKFISSVYAVLTVLGVTVCGLILEPHVEVSTIAMLYILGSVLIARNSGRTECVVASIVSILSFNFFFIDPKYTLVVQNPEYLATFLVMLTVSLSISGLVTRIRLQNKFLEQREKRAITLYEAGRAIHEAADRPHILKATHESLSRLGDIDCGILMIEDGSLSSGVSSKTFFEIERDEFAVAKFVMNKRTSAGKLTDILPGSGALYLPLQTERTIYGVCGVYPLGDNFGQELIPVIELILQQAALGLERLSFEAKTMQSNLRIETEAMRTIILSSVSHDFRTPLTVIEGAAEQILKTSPYDGGTYEFAALITEHSKRLSRMVDNALSFARLEQGNTVLNLEWESIEEIIGQALDKYRKEFMQRMVDVNYPDDLPLLRGDAVLLDQLITNVIENSLIHAPTATFFHVKVEVENNDLKLAFSDDGPGLTNEAERKVIRDDTKKHSGSGLGLSICAAIAKLHGGVFKIEHNKNGGTKALLQIPINRDTAVSEI